MDPNATEFETPPKLASRYGCDARLIRAAIKRGELIAYRLTPRGYHRVRRSDFEAYLRRHVVAPARPAERQHAARVVERRLERESAST